MPFSGCVVTPSDGSASSKKGKCPVIWRHYKETFWRMQLLISSVCVGVYVWSHLLALTAFFFCTMQLASAVGGLWAERLKRKLQFPLLPPPTAQ